MFPDEVELYNDITVNDLRKLLKKYPKDATVTINGRVDILIAYDDEDNTVGFTDGEEDFDSPQDIDVDEEEEIFDDNE